MRAELGGSAVTVATGGLAFLIFDHASTLDKLDPLLTLKGLEIIFRRNHRSVDGTAGTDRRRPRPWRRTSRAPSASARSSSPTGWCWRPWPASPPPAYRRHLKTHGAGLVTTEMVSAYGLLHGNRRTEDYLRFAEEERPVAVQLFGDTPEVMARAARARPVTRPGAG